jgi:hypothetical protein
MTTTSDPALPTVAAFCSDCRYSAGMATSITIRHVPQDVRNTLAARAAKDGRSLQEYMLDQVIRLAAKPSIHDLVDDVRRRKQRTPRQVTRKMILEARDADRR